METGLFTRTATLPNVNDWGLRKPACYDRSPVLTLEQPRVALMETICLSYSLGEIVTIIKTSNWVEKAVQGLSLLQNTCLINNGDDSLKVHGGQQKNVSLLHSG